MCFSTVASFCAAAVLAAQGGVAVLVAPTRRHLPLAAVPLLFSVQQTCEGLLWRVIEVAPFNRAASPLVLTFLVFALCVWPAYFPLALLTIEPREPRRAALVVLTMLGWTVGGYLLACASFHRSDACLAYGNLYYFIQVDTGLKRAAPFLYLFSVAAPFSISSVRGTSWLAASLVGSFAVSACLFRAGFLSVWCFLAALLSGGFITVIVADRRRISSFDLDTGARRPRTHGADLPSTHVLPSEVRCERRRSAFRRFRVAAATGSSCWPGRGNRPSSRSRFAWR
jgi:hypothetical protein